MQTVLMDKADELGRELGFVQRLRKLSGSKFVQALVFGFQAELDASYEDLDTTRTPIAARAVAGRLVGCSPQLSKQIKPLLGNAHAAWKGVIEEHRRRLGVGMVRRRKPADIPPIAHGKQGEQANGRRLHGV
jgi:hypothetical protein